MDAILIAVWITLYFTAVWIKGDAYDFKWGDSDSFTKYDDAAGKIYTVMEEVFNLLHEAFNAIKREHTNWCHVNYMLFMCHRQLKKCSKSC